MAAGGPSSAGRADRNAAVFREANEAIEAARRRLGIDGRVPFVCECDRATCTRLVLLAPEEYRRARSRSRRFVVAPGHSAATDRVMEQTESFVIVEEGAGDMAEPE